MLTVFTETKYILGDSWPQRKFIRATTLARYDFKVRNEVNFKLAKSNYHFQSETAFISVARAKALQIELMREKFSLV